jgi:hypothetical protein
LRAILAQHITPTLLRMERTSGRIIREASDWTISAAGGALTSLGSTCIQAGKYCRQARSKRS